MKKNYYLFNPGRVSRKDNTLKFIPKDENKNFGNPKYLPIEGIKALYIFGSIDANSAFYTFMGKAQVPIHFFDYYEHYRGSFMPKEYLHAGKMQINQTKTYLDAERRQYMARKILQAATSNMLKNVQYYNRRKTDLSAIISKIESLQSGLKEQIDIPSLMGIEGNIRLQYYEAFGKIIDHFEFNHRRKQPPSNEVNALISFGNMVCYTYILDQIYHTQLNPTISFLHEPGTRRYSLSLDIAEIFKPLLIDRTIFKLCNKGMVKDNDFERNSQGCFLKEKGKKTFLKAFEERIKQTIKHKDLNRKVSYGQLIKLECYKIAKYCLEIEKDYSGFKIWW